MTERLPDLLTGTELSLVAEVGKAENRNGPPRWQQVHFNKDVARQFFRLQPGDDRSITLEKLSAAGKVIERVSKKLVFSERNIDDTGAEHGPGGGRRLGRRSCQQRRSAAGRCIHAG